MERSELERIVDAITQRVQSELKRQGRGAGDAGPVGRPSGESSTQGLAQFIDHTLLKPEATQDQLKVLCDEAREYSFYSVCVNSSNVPFCRKMLGGSGVKVVAVVGFPLGAASTETKVFEARDAVAHGAEEVDMVINIGELKSRNYRFVENDIRRLVEAVAPARVKVIIETGMLTQNEKIAACVLSKAAGAHFVKTSTGFNKGGATVEDVALMKELVGADMEVKASGGIRDQQTALAMLKAGATRIGASASVEIATGKKGGGKGY